MREKEEFIKSTAEIRNEIKLGFKEHFIDMVESEKWNRFDELFQEYYDLMDEMDELDTIDPEQAEVEEEYFEECKRLESFVMNLLDEFEGYDLNGENIIDSIRKYIEQIKELMCTRNKLNSTDDSIGYKLINEELKTYVGHFRYELSIVEYVAPELARKLKEPVSEIQNEYQKSITGQGDSKPGLGETIGRETSGNDR